MITNRQVQQANRTRLVRVSERAVKIVGPIFQWIVKRLPALRSRLTGTLGGRSGAVFSLIDKKDYRQAFQLALESVTYCETHKSAFEMNNLYWWVFLDSAARCATELGDSERQQVLTRAVAAPVPGGLNEASCLEKFSRWQWRGGDADGAIEFARRAVLADATWPEGHLLLAWYGLITGKFDPLPRLREAVRVSPDSLAEIRANRDFARFPDLIAALESDGSARRPTIG